jgi:hypothetical protein
MSIISKLFKKSRIIDAQTYASPVYSLYSNTARYITGDGVNFQTNSYRYCPPLQGVIQKRANALTRGVILPVDDKDQVITSSAFNKDMKILSRPNQFQNMTQFLGMIETMICVYGVAYIYKIKPVGFKEASGFVVIPNTCITPSYKTSVNILDNQSGIVDSYTLNLYGMSFVLKDDDVNLITEVRDSTVNTMNAYQPKSRLDALEYPIKNIVASLESRNTIIVRRGADVIISPKNGDTAAIMSVMTPAEKKALQDEYARYGTLGEQWHTMIARVPMDAVNIGRSVQQLGLFDGENADHRAIASAFGVPVPLLSMPDTAKYSTYGEAKKELYEDTIIPESQVISEMLDGLFNTSTKGYKFYFDYSMLECMQKSEKDKADALGAMVKALNEAVSANLMGLDEAKKLLTDYTN